MIYSLSLENALLGVGLFLILSHLPALLGASSVQERLKRFPRSTPSGAVLFSAAAGWFFWLLYSTDLGEFSSMRGKFLMFTAAAYVLTLRFGMEFLSVRALGMLLLLVAEPLLESAWLRPETGRLCLVGLVYLWIVCGLFFIGTPYILRDLISWVSASALRWKAASLAGIVYGAILIGIRASIYSTPRSGRVGPEPRALSF
jgi:hypothetical protein